MAKSLRLQILGEGTADIRVLEAALKTKGFEVSSHFTPAGSNGLSLPENAPVSDVVIVSLGRDWEGWLNAMRPNGNALGASLIVVGPKDNTQCMRSAMHIGARDYLSHPVLPEEFYTLLSNVGQQRASAEQKNSPQITTVINTAGGSGASFMATNIAHIIAAKHKASVALLDLDLQFGSLALNLDVNLHYGMSEVLAMTSKIDALALPSYMSKHSSGLHILGEKLDHIVLPGEIPPESVERLLVLSTQAFEHTIVDMPRQIDPIFAAVATRSSRFILVMQQTLTHVRDAKRLITILRQDFETPLDRIMVIVNRYDEKLSIKMKDIEGTLGQKPVAQLANDYQRAVAATEIATPFVDFAPTSPLAKGLQKLVSDIFGKPEGTEKPFFTRAMERLLGSKK